MRGVVVAASVVLTVVVLALLVGTFGFAWLHVTAPSHVEIGRAR